MMHLWRIDVDLYNTYRYSLEIQTQQFYDSSEIEFNEKHWKIAELNDAQRFTDNLLHVRCH